MSLEKNKAIVRKVIEAENKKDLALLDELIAPDYFSQTFQLRGLEGYKQYYARAYKGFPDWHETIEDIIAEGDNVCIRLKITGTHRGEYRGLAPTGKKITFTGIQIWHIVEGKVVEKESVYDLLDFYKQLGVIEYKGFPDEVK
jgi:steroid delta-isomerase-like uncharacterized protein